MPVVSSTNDVAKELAARGCSEGTAILADFQTSGKGRLGRRWCAPPRSSLLLSMVLRPDVAPCDIHRLTMLCGLAVVAAVQLEVGLGVDLKWPNDIVCRGRKLGGILAEAGLLGERVEYCVVGLGLNVDLDADLLGTEVATPATSLSREVGKPVRLALLSQCFLAEVDAKYTAMRNGWSPHSDWAASLATLGQVVTISGRDRRRSGVAYAVEPSGALLVRLADGRTERVVAEDVTLRDDFGWHQPGMSGRIKSGIISE